MIPLTQFLLVFSQFAVRASNGMERKFRYGIWKMPEWNRIEDFKNGMEGNLLYFHTNSILDFAHGIYRKFFTYSGY